jgi:putative phosphoesterase
MVKIGLVSDTHGSIDDKLSDFFKDVDEIWHAGDIGSLEVIKTLCESKKLRAVFGNIDDAHIRKLLPEHERFIIEGLDVWMTHIGGYPGRYDKKVKAAIYTNPPKLFITGHSHILKVMYDEALQCLHINPGAYGLSGMHVVRTAVRFEIERGEVKHLEVLEVKR